MKLNFKKIVIENFLSIGNATIDLHNRGFTLITGVNNNPKDSALSNGSGKSSIMEAICWALTGETVRGIKDVVNMFADGGTCVELYFDVDKDSYIIKRYKEHSKYKTDLKIYINGDDKSGKGIRDSQKLLESYLPDLNISLLGSVVILGQGLPQRFTNNAPSGRKEVLEKLSKSDFMIEDLKRRLSERKLYIDNQLRAVEDTLLMNNTKISTLRQQIEVNKGKLSSLEDPSIYSDIIDKAKYRVEELTNKMNDTNLKIDESQLQLQHLQESKSLIISEVKDKQKQDELKFISTKSELLHLISDTKKDINLTTKKIQDAKSIQDTCPTCGRKFDNVFIPDTVADEILLKELQKQLIIYNEQLNKLTNEYDDFVDKCDIEIKNNTLEIDNKIKELQAHLSNYNSSMSSTRREKAEEERNLQKYEQLKLNFEVTVKTLTDSIRSNEEDIKNLEQEVVYNSVSKENLSDRVAIINKFILMTTRDFRGHLLKNVIKYIDDKAKDYCEEVFGTRELDFILSGNNIDIKYCGKYMESLSGGEKQKIDLIIQFSIRDMLCQFLDFRSNIIALDEIFDALDSVSCDKVVNLISKGLSDIDSVFIITHHKELGIPDDNIITVTKQANGVSTVI